MKKYMIGFLVFVSIAISCFAGKYDYYFHMVTPRPDSFLGRIAAPFQAGYFYTDEQKDSARKRIAELNEEYKRVRASNRFNPDKDRLKEIEKKIYEQQLITGDAWSKQRKVALATVALLGASALSFGLYKYMHQSPKDSNVLSSTFEKPWLSFSEAQKVAKNMPYHSPAPVDPDDFEGLKNRLDEIKKQKQVQVEGWFFDNPNFNRKDLEEAEKQYQDFRNFQQNIDRSVLLSLSPDRVRKLYGGFLNLNKVQDLAKELRIEIQLPPELPNDLYDDKIAYAQRALDYVRSLEKDRKAELLINPNSDVKAVAVPLTWYEWLQQNYYPRFVLTGESIRPLSNQNQILPQSDASWMDEADAVRAYD
jgi:hypothetical protein